MGPSPASRPSLRIRMRNRVGSTSIERRSDRAIAGHGGRAMRTCLPQGVPGMTGNSKEAPGPAGSRGLR